MKTITQYSQKEMWLTVRLCGGLKSSTVVSLLWDTSKNVRYGRVLSADKSI